MEPLDLVVILDLFVLFWMQFYAAYPNQIW